MVGHVRGIVRMAVAQFWHHRLECIQHVEISAGIEVGSREGSGGMQYQQMTDACNCGMRLLNLPLNFFRDIEHFALLASFKFQPLHGIMAAR